MKRKYFDNRTIDRVARDMLQVTSQVRERRSPLRITTASALLVLDMQDYFLDPASHAFIPSSSAIIPNIQRLVQSYSQNGKPVIFTRHLNTQEDANSMSTWWRDLITEDSPLSRISQEISTDDAILVKKSQYDAFFNTELEEILVERRISHLVICGVMTHLCCETTARSAFIRGFDVWFTIDGTATYNEDFHRAALLNLSHGFATPVLVSEVLMVMQDDGKN